MSGRTVQATRAGGDGAAGGTQTGLEGESGHGDGPGAIIYVDDGRGRTCVAASATPRLRLPSGRCSASRAYTSRTGVERLLPSFFGAAATSVASALSGRVPTGRLFSYRVDSHSARKAVAHCSVSTLYTS